jgi:DnaJ like chaperone protein
MTGRSVVGLAIVLAFVLAYVRSPIDILPDQVGLIGFIDDLLVAVALVTWWRRRFAGRHGAAPLPRPENATDRAATAPWDPYAVLGVPRGAATGAIDRAYRERMKEYHPDRVAHLGEELRALAHQKTLAIQRAYTEIGKR